MSLSGRESLTGGREALPGCPVEVVRPSRMYGSGREAFLDVLEWSGGPRECPGVVGRLSWMSWSGREALLDVWEWSGSLPR